MAEYFTNAAQTSLIVSISDSDTSIQVDDASSFPTVAPFRIRFRQTSNYEVAYVTALAGTTWTVVRAYEAYAGIRASYAFTSGATVELVPTAGSLVAISTRDKAIIRPDLAHSLDDEFDNEALDSSWIRVDNATDAGNVTWTEGADVLSCKNVGAGAADRFHALLKPLGGLTFPVTIETATRTMSQYAINYLMTGIGFADGTTYNAGKQYVTFSYVYSGIATAYRIASRGITGFNTNVSSNDTGINVQMIGGPFYQRLIWTAANTFVYHISVDGVSWWTIGTYSYTMTPTHAGFFVSHWGTSETTIFSAEYFRVYTTNKAGSY